jgi:hypothetical protein
MPPELMNSPAPASRGGHRTMLPNRNAVAILPRRAQGAVKAGRRGYLASCSGVARPRLDGSEHGVTLKQFGATSCLS